MASPERCRFPPAARQWAAMAVARPGSGCRPVGQRNQRTAGFSRTTTSPPMPRSQPRHPGAKALGSMRSSRAWTTGTTQSRRPALPGPVAASPQPSRTCRTTTPWGTTGRTTVASSSASSRACGQAGLGAAASRRRRGRRSSSRELWWRSRRCQLSPRCPSRPWAAEGHPSAGARSSSSIWTPSWWTAQWTGGGTACSRASTSAARPTRALQSGARRCSREGSSRSTSSGATA
mmetsp:Transcript_24012/g.71813  ORF Transcript_24012/g.71813 Transcript_24012/m.71813 type:complete len:233 (-) Transcript_24012:1075-1773(-)